MERTALLALYDRELRLEIEFPDQRKETNRHITRIERSDGGMNSILYSRLERYNADAVIAEQVRYFQTQGKSFTWKIFQHDPFPELRDRLLAYGFRADVAEPVMVLDVHSVSDELKTQPELDVRRVVWPEQLDEVAQLEAQVWGGDFSWLRRRLAGWLAWPGYLSVYVGYMLDQPACAGWIVFHPDSQFASLYGGSTLEEYRGRGLYKAVLACRLQEAMQRGRPYLIVEPTEINQPIMSRYGFEVLTYTQDYLWAFPGSV
jgi:hypothetical protein